MQPTWHDTTCLWSLYWGGNSINGILIVVLSSAFHINVQVALRTHRSREGYHQWQIAWKHFRLRLWPGLKSIHVSMSSDTGSFCHVPYRHPAVLARFYWGLYGWACSRVRTHDLCVKCLWRMKDRVPKRGIVHLSEALGGKEHTTTTCVQMAMHGPCHEFFSLL